jgi:hypothetical protein
LVQHENLSLFTLQSLRGTRDGDRLRTQAVFSDSSSILTVEMRFAIGSPTTLESGAWKWARNNQMLSGSVAARSVTFLGGQDGPPSIGGTFDLLSTDGVVRYRVTIRVTELKVRFQQQSGSTEAVPLLPPTARSLFREVTTHPTGSGLVDLTFGAFDRCALTGFDGDYLERSVIRAA